MENIVNSATCPEVPPPEEKRAVSDPWYASLWFNLLMISISMCFCSIPAFYPLISLGKNHSINERQKRFVKILGITVAILSIVVNAIFMLFSTWEGIHWLRNFKIE